MIATMGLAFAANLPGFHLDNALAEARYDNDMRGMFVDNYWAAQARKRGKPPTLKKPPKPTPEEVRKGKEQQEQDRKSKRNSEDESILPFSQELLRNGFVFLVAMAGNGHPANEAKSAGADDIVIFCQAYKESRFKFAAQAGSHRGYLQMGPSAAKDIGLTQQEYETAIADPTESIRISTRYLAKRINNEGGDLKAGLNGYGTGPGYADSIIRCADKIKSFKTPTLGQIYDALLENGKP